MPVSPEKLTMIQSQGAHTRVLNFGTRTRSCASEKMPAAAGCASADWQVCAETWDARWEMEDGIRSPEELAAIMIHLGA